VEYTYNRDDLRTHKLVKKSDNNYEPEITNFLYDRQHVMLETDETNTVKIRYIRGINCIAYYYEKIYLSTWGGTALTILMNYGITIGTQ